MFVLDNGATSEAFAKLYLNEELADVHFKFNVDDKTQRIPANKANLAILSPVFRTMFFGSLTEKGDVEIVDASIGAFKEFLQLFYPREVTLTMEHIETVARLADKYDVLEYFNECVASLKDQLTLDNMCCGYQLAVNLGNEDLIQFCEDKIAKSTTDIFATDAFLRCDRVALKRLLKLDLACMEVDVFDACLSWAKHTCKQNNLDGMQPENLRNQLGDCLHLLRFGSMQLDEFCKRCMLHRGLFTATEYEDVMFSIASKEYQPTIFNRIPRHLKWDEDKKLELSRRTSNPEPVKYVQLTEVASFSSNCLLLLGGFRTTILPEYVPTKKSTQAKIIITESKDFKFRSDDSPRVLYRGTSEYWNG
ncbi:BTB/POZ domain-containing protein 2-like [Sitodiplosis mosellana]|uniref:BTB/POZ domain-containing protein 2-like n=1 Tax=Sitodiplosis mosellana TaxID=263140 RepID=UPI0024452EEF|nr:BTB/POZ domain-containing protein 2-like [Sitodiplosis mosellana]